MKTKPVIAVLPLHDAAKETIWINPLYMGGVEEAGGLPVLLPLSENSEHWKSYVETFDGFVFTGGQDIAPSIYGQEKLPQCGYQSVKRDNQETAMFRMLLELDKPVLGICRGIQLMNAAAGGTLYQDLDTQHPSAVVHRQSMPYNLPHHQIRILPGTLLSSILPAEHLSVNSMHHQAVCTPAPGFRVSAYAEDGIPEAIEHPGKRFMLGVQWHPEHLWQDYASARLIWKAFVAACAEG